MINVSEKDVSTQQTNVLTKGLNFAVAPRNLPFKEIITNTEFACSQLVDKEKAQELRSDVVRILKRAKAPISNISKDERIALANLKRNNDIILPEDKGRATVVMDKEKYEKKINALLQDKATYKKLTKDPTSKYKNKLINMSRKWNGQKTSGGSCPTGGLELVARARRRN
ncbi:uncharacterized protein LOC117114121 [Anneissia japonica]|uniref:uncharacterized protein LOC117114121 n=1 Tax=Anneissia japonica TaxID=1529436 RepID=UPI001425A9CA|nr:uncharacterized protein LOC117114121 [Anneissia japonica]